MQLVVSTRRSNFIFNVESTRDAIPALIKSLQEAGVGYGLVVNPCSNSIEISGTFSDQNQEALARVLQRDGDGDFQFANYPVEMPPAARRLVAVKTHIISGGLCGLTQN